MAGSVITSSAALTRLVGSPPDLSRKAHALLADRFPPARVKHKPLSILRQEGRRALEQMFEAEFPAVPRTDRDRTIEEVLGEAVGFGPLEELFRDDTIQEVMVLAAAQVIARKNDAWVPTSVRFRDAAHLRVYLQKVADTGEQMAGLDPPAGACDVRIANGFRVIGVFPPEVLGLPPTAVFRRGDVPQTTAPAFPPRMPGGSTGVSMSAMTRQSPLSAPTPTPPAAKPAFQVFSQPLPVPTSRIVPDAEPADPNDPVVRLKQRVTERIIRKCAAAGVYDLNVISTPELQRIILANVDDLNTVERLGLDEPLMQRLTLEILAGMSR